jgi:hypothetical protein
MKPRSKIRVTSVGEQATLTIGRMLSFEAVEGGTCIVEGRGKHRISLLSSSKIYLL